MDLYSCFAKKWKLIHKAGRLLNSKFHISLGEVYEIGTS